MTRELENAQRAIRRNRMFAALLEKNAEQLVPESLVRMEAAHMAHEARLEQQIEDVQRRREVAIRVFGELARDRVRMSLLVNKLLEERKLELDQARVDARIQSIAATYENPQEVVDWYKKDRETLRRLEAAILEEQLVDQLYEQAQVSEEDKTFQEVMALGQQRG